MKKQFKILFALGCSCLLAASSAFAADYVSITTDNANVRTGPGTNYPASMELFEGYPLKVNKKEGEWYQVSDFENDSGWVHDSIVKKSDTVIVNTKTIVSCGCATGCPSCVHSPKCGSGNRPIDKKACLFLLAEILRQKSNKSDKSQSLRAGHPVPMNFEHLLPGTVQQRRGLDALPAKFGVFDLETIRSAEEVGGWGNTHKMGVSVAVVYDSELNDFVSYLEHEVDKLVDHLASFELVVGFNNKRFDNRVLSAYTDLDLAQLPTLDLLEEVHNYLGYRLSLNRLAEQTLGTKKTADGLQALAWYKEGRIDLIQHYCKKDVEITRDILYTALEQGFLLFTNKAKQIVRLPLALDAAIEKILKN